MSRKYSTQKFVHDDLMEIFQAYKTIVWKSGMVKQMLSTVSLSAAISLSFQCHLVLNHLFYFFNAKSQ